MKLFSVPSLVLFVLAATFLGVGGGIGLLWGKPLVDRARASEHWPQTVGRIMNSELRESMSDGTRMYSADIVYRYQVEDREYVSGRVWFGGSYSTSDRSEMMALVGSFPPGMDVTVFYSPDDPGEAVLMPGAWFSTYILYATGLVFLGIGLLLLVILVVLLLKRQEQVAAEELASAGFDEFPFETRDHRW